MHMLSRVDMAPAAATGPAFKLFGKLITQPMHAAAPDAAAASPQPPSPVFGREKLEPEQPSAPDDPRRDREPKREAQDGAGGRETDGQPRRAQHEASAEARAAAAAPLPCPRCRSRDTKFCYFNNYNVNQPRHFCKACHRYWTAGGALRNVPVGAGRRKNRPGGPPPAAAAGGGHHRAAAGFVLGFPSPASPASPSPVYADRWPVSSDRRF